MKRIISLCLVMSIMLSLLQTTFASASEQQSYNELGVVFDKSTGIITAADKALSGSLTIPQSIDGTIVSGIEVGAFANCTALTEIYVPDSVTYIGDYAFYNCEDLIITASEASPAIQYAIQNSMEFVITNNITSYDYLADASIIYKSRSKALSGYACFEIAYRVKEDAALTSKELVVYLPDSVKLMESTLKVNGLPTSNYEYKDSFLTVPSEDNAVSITFCVDRIRYADMAAYAKLNFAESGVQKTQTIGVVESSEPFITVSTTDKTSLDYVPIKGIAPASSNVEIYVDGEYYDVTFSYETGEYYIDVALPEPENYKSYTITAKVSKVSGEVSGDATVMYHSATPALSALVMTHNEQEVYLNSFYGEKPEVTFDSSPFKFEAFFENTEKLEQVYVVSTKNNQKKYMPAIWNEETQSYVAEGYFDNTDKDYVPGEITVEYKKKKIDVPISETLDNASELLSHMDSAVKESTITVTENTADCYAAKIHVADEIRDLISDEINFVVKTFDKEFNDIPLSDLMVTKENFYSYFIEKDSEKYVLNLDYTDPETLNMIVNDITKSRKLVYTFDFCNVPEPGVASTPVRISDALGQIGLITGTVSDMYDMKNDDKELREKILLSGMSQEEQAIALKKADELKQDRDLFLATTLIVSVATLGTGGMSGIAFGLLFGIVTTSSDFFWNMRMDSIAGACCDWQSGGIIDSGEFGIYEDNLSYTLDSSGVLTISGVGGMGSNAGMWLSYFSQIKKVNITGKVTDIANEAFEGCCNLESVTMPDSIKSIGELAFSGCTLLKEVKIPANVTSISDMAFYGCKSLENVEFHNKVTHIGYRSFSGCTNLESVDLPYSLKSIASLAFANCISLKSIDIPADTKDIDVWLFEGCSSLESIDIPAHAAGIANRVFYNCDNIAKVNIKDGDVTLTQESFQPFRKIEEISIGKGNTTIGEWAFEGFLNLKSFSISGGNVNIGTHAFDTCISLISVDLPKGTQSIGGSAFYECSALTSIDIPDSVTDLGANAFYNCVNLKSADLSESLEVIKNNSFSNCVSLESIYIPQSVTSIDYEAFSECSALKKVYIHDSITSIGDSAFSGCTSLAEVNYTGSNQDWWSIDISTLNNPLLYARRNCDWAVSAQITVFDVIADTVNSEADIKISAKNISDSATVYAASYSDGRLCSIAPVTFGDGKGKASLSWDQTGTIKAFIWDMNNIKPLCAPSVHTSAQQ